MGQRSQIYIRYKTKTGYRLIANYYQWNYGERMISRARYGIEYLEYHREYLGWWFRAHEEFIRRYFDVNFDYKDIVMHSNINEEFAEYGQDYEFNEYVFHGQENNDGKLLIDVSETEIRYAFLDDTGIESSIMSPLEYMDWDEEEWQTSQYVDRITLKENVDALENFQLMTTEQIHDFLTCPYENDPTIPF